MRLAIGADQAVRADEDVGVPQRVAVPIEQAADDVEAEPRGLALERLRRRARDLLGVGHRLLAAVEHVARDRALGQHEQLRAGGGRRLHAHDAGGEILLLLAELRVDLRNRDLHLRRV